MATILELREKCAEAWEGTKAFLESHRTEKGTLTAEDDGIYSRMEKDIDDLGVEIARLERQEARDAELAKAVNTPLTGKPMSAPVEKKGRASDAYKEDFGLHLRGKRLVHNVLSEGVDANGGYLVPEEFEHQIVDTPHEKYKAKLLEVGAIRIKKDSSGQEHWKAIHRGKLINRTDIEILSKYNAEVRGLANFYALACNPTAMAHFSSLMKYSMLKTFAAKYRTKVSKIKTRYMKNGNFAVAYETKAGSKESVYYNKGFKRKTEPLFGQIDLLETYKRYARPNGLIRKLRAKTCELCGAVCDDIEIHQVKRLKVLTGNSVWEMVMLSRHRKTLAVCPACHLEIHTSIKS